MASRTTKESANLDLFFDALRGSNPFHSNRVNAVDATDADVESINKNHFETLARMALDSLREKHAQGAMVLGGSGVGKSHLLVRLARSAAERRWIYVYLHNVLASPEHVPQQFLRYVISVLTNGQGADSPLYGILNAAIKKALAAAGVPKRTSPERCLAVLQDYIRNSSLNFDTSSVQIVNAVFVYFKLINSRSKSARNRDQLKAVVSLLSGDSIASDYAKEFGLDPKALEAVDEGLLSLGDNEKIKQVLLILTELASIAKTPFVICVDQVDNLDSSQVQALARFLHTLIDQSRNLLVVTSGVKESMLEFESNRVIAEAAWDRLASRKIELRRINPAEGRLILARRLETFFEPFSQLSSVDELRTTHQFFPLPENAFEREFGERTEFRARDVITWARDQWRDEQQLLTKVTGPEYLKNWGTENDGGDNFIHPPVDRQELIRRAIQNKIRESVTQHLANPGSLPPDSDNLCTLLFDLLKVCEGREEQYSLRAVRRILGQTPSYHLEVKEVMSENAAEVINVVTFLTATDGRAAWGVLKRLALVNATFDRRILVTDSDRAPVPSTPKCDEFYQMLQNLGPDQFRHIELTFQDYATLDALRGVIGQARVGDLEVYHASEGSITITEPEAINVMHRLDLFREHPLIAELTQEPASPVAPSPPVLLPEDGVRKTIKGNLAWMFCATTFQIAEIFLSENNEFDLTLDEAHKQVISISRKMNDEEVILAREHQGGFLLQLCK